MEGRVMRQYRWIWVDALTLRLIGLGVLFFLWGACPQALASPSVPTSQPAAASALSATTNANPNDRLPLRSTSPSPIATPSTPLTPSTTSPASPSPSSGLTSAWLSNTLIALVVVIGLILLLRLAIGRFNGRMGPPARRNSPAIEVLSRVAVAPKNHLLLVRIGQRLLVLGDSPNGLSSLANLDNPEEVAAILLQIASSKPGSATAQFQQMLSKMSGQYQADRPDNDPTQTGGDDREADIDHARSELASLSAKLKQITPSASSSSRQGGQA